ncbi:MAG: DoxX family protein [Acidimicrobiales bacterium]
MNNVLSRLDLGAGYATSALRIGVGVLLAWHGYRKFADGLDGLEGFLSFLDLPAPGFLAVVVALLELVGGILLALGLFTRPVAALFVIHFGLIFVWVKLIKLDPVFLVGGEQPGVELDLIYLLTSAFFLIGGPGQIAVDRVLGLETSTERSSAAREPVMA